MKTVIEMAREAGWDDHHAEFDTRIERFAELVRADERAEVERLKSLCDEMLSELYVYRASEYLKDVTAAIRARGQA